MDAIEERRQRAREAGCDAIESGGQLPPGRVLEEAIETATRVTITLEIMIAAECENVFGPVSVEAVRAAFMAAGFEVVE